MNKKTTIKDIRVGYKRVLMRVDFNVPFDAEAGEITNDRRIRQALPTLRYLLKNRARLVLVSHLGRPEGKKDPSLSLEPVRARLAKLLKVPVALLDLPLTDEVIEQARSIKSGECAIIENIRFEPGEEANDRAFAKRLACMCELFVMDAFGTAHRAHASTEGVAHFVPAVAGLLVDKEIRFLGQALAKPKRPFVAVLGGAKVDTKLGVIVNLVSKVDCLLVGGAMAYPFLKASGAKIGNSLAAAEDVKLAGQLLERIKSSGVKFLLPTDHVCGNKFAEDAKATTCQKNIPAGRMGLDIGPKTARVYASRIKKAGTVVWNGPVGKFEWKAFSKGTEAIVRALAGCSGTTIVGGGETAEAVEEMGLDKKISHVSTGGGACLEFLEGKILPGIDILEDVPPKKR